MGRQPDGAVLVPTQQTLRPFGQSIEFPGRPTDMALFDKGRLLAVKSRTDLVILGWKDRVVRQSLPVPQEGLSYHGLAIAADEKQLFVTGSHDRLWVARLEKGVAVWDEPIKLPGPKGKGPSAPGGIALQDAKLYVTLSRNNALGVVDLAQKKVTKEIQVGIAPYTVLVAGKLA